MVALRPPLIASFSPSAPRIGGELFKYLLHSLDGDDLGEATYAQMIHPDEEIIAGNAQRFRVLDVVPFEEEDDSPFVGLLEVEAAALPVCPTGYWGDGGVLWPWRS